MKIFMTTGSIFWNPARDIFKNHLDDIILMQLDERQKVTVDGVKKIQCNSGVVTLGSIINEGYTNAYYMKLIEKKPEIEAFLKEDEDVIVLADSSISSLYIFKALQKSEKKIRLHLWSISPFVFEGTSTRKKYDKALSNLDNTKSVRITNPLRLIKDKDIKLEDCIEKCIQKIDEQFEHYLLKLNFLEEGEVYFYDAYREQFVFVDESNAAWETHHMPKEILRLCTQGIAILETTHDVLDDEEKLRRIKQPVPRPDGKAVCRKLKELRKAFADANNIPYFPKECKYEGPCAGTCAHCDADMELIKKSKWGLETKYPQYEIIAEEIYRTDNIERIPDGMTLGFLMKSEEGWE